MQQHHKGPTATDPHTLNVTRRTIANAVLLPEIVRMLDEGHTVTMQLRGVSMRPFLEDTRDKALLAKATAPRVGDPVLAEIQPGVFVLHRLVDISGDEATLLGDGNLCCEHCRMQDIRGVALGFYRKGRPTLDAVSGRKWRCYSWIWTRLRPVRRWLLAAYRRIWMPLFGAI